MAGDFSVGAIYVPVIVVRTGNKMALKQVNSELKQITAQMQKMSVTGVASAKKVDSSMAGLMKRLNTLRWGLVNITFIAAGLSMLAYPFIALTKFGMELESVFARVAIVTGSTTEQIKNDLVELRKGTMFSIEDMGKAYLEFAKQGYSASQSLQALPAITRLSVVGFTDLANATKIVGQVMHQFGLEATSASHIVDVIAHAANVSAADVETFGLALSYAGPIAAQAGLEFEETAAALAILSNMGLQASKSGTSMAAAITKMLKPTDKVKGMLSDMGIQLFTASGEMRDLDLIVKSLAATLGTMSEQDSGEFLTELGGARGARAFSGWITSLETGQGTLKSFEDQITQTGYALDKFAKISATTAKVHDAAWQDFRASAIDSANVFSQLWGSLLRGYKKQDLTKILQKLNEDIAGLEDGIDPIEIDIGTSKASPAFDWNKERDEINRTTVAYRKLIEASITKYEGIGIDYSEAIIYSEQLQIMSGALIRARTQLNMATADGKIFNDTILTSGKTVKETREEIDNLLTTTMSGFAEPLEIAKMEEVKVIIVDDSNKIKKPLETAREQIKGIKEFIGDNITLSKDWATIFPNISDELGNILNSKIDVTKLTKEELDALGPIFDIVSKTALAMTAQEQAAIGLGNQMDKLLGSVSKSMDPEEVITLMGYYEQLNKMVAKAAQAGGLDEAFKIDTQIIYPLKQAIEVIREAYAEIDKLTVSKKKLQASIKVSQHDLKIENALLKQQKEALDDVEQAISNLSKARFEGETETSKILGKANLWLKKQELAQLGVADAQTFINSQLGKTNVEYEEMFGQLSKINSEMDNNANAFKAWQTTIKTAISAEVEAGQQLSKDVTSRVKVWQTALMGIQATQGAGDQKTGMDDYLNKLQLSYDVYFGGMHDEVSNFLQVQEDRELGVYGSSQQIISALEAEFVKRADLLIQIEDQTIKVEKLNAELAIEQEKLYQINLLLDIQKEIIEEELKKTKELILEKGKEITASELVTTAIDNFRLATIKAQKELEKIKVPHSGYSEPTRNEQVQDVIDGIEEPVKPTETVSDTKDFDASTWLQDALDKQTNDFGSGAFDGTGTSGMWNDFIMRPGQAPVAFSAQDTLVGTKSGPTTGGNKIDVTINMQASGELNYDATQLAREIKTQMGQ